MHSHLPIIYVRGYAGTADAVESAVSCPYYGFNEGSAKVRTGPDGDPELYLFESPMIRLMKDHGYSDLFVRIDRGRVFLLKPTEKESYPEKSLWVFRYYDDTSEDIGSGTRHRIETLGRQLTQVIDYVRQKTGADKVHLVAHSMGGLVCRSAIQKTMKKTKAKAKAKIARLFTYGTPHGGIHFRRGLGWASWLRDILGPNHADNFGPKEMRSYLGFPKNHPEERLNELGGQLDPQRCFSFIGTNHDDYTVRMSKASVGPGSDGLVMLRHAYVKGSNRAFAHRSHSGPYGIVNSEEGYQNLQRFLFGDTAVKITLKKVRPKTSIRKRNDGAELKTVVVEAALGLRAEAVQLTEQLQRDGSAQPVAMSTLEKGEETLFHAFLMKSRRPNGRFRYSQFQLQIRIVPIYTKDHWLSSESSYAGQAIFATSLFAAVGDPDNKGKRKVKVAWGSMEDALDKGNEFEIAQNSASFEIDLPTNEQWIDSGKLVFEVHPWEV